MEYTIILIISLLKWVDALVLLRAFYSIPKTAWQKLVILMTTYFSFDQICEIICSHLDKISFRPLQFTICILEVSQDLHVKNPRLLNKISFNIYCVWSVDQAFCESLYIEGWAQDYSNSNIFLKPLFRGNLDPFVNNANLGAIAHTSNGT